MQDREDYNAFGLDPEKDGVREFRKYRTSHFTMHTREHFRIALDGIESGINRGKKPFSQTVALSFVVTESASEVPSDFPTVYDRQAHQPLRASASTWSLETTSSGLRSCSARRSSITAQWASPKGTEDGSAARLSQMISARRKRSPGGRFKISATSASLMPISVPLLPGVCETEPSIRWPRPPKCRKIRFLHRILTP